ncbi:hypothetical protein KM043_003971 [Ampulex compressa]|nr:hypothetical protein KM043_003971 [Ampulex compressa]
MCIAVASAYAARSIVPTTARITSVAFEYWAAVKAGVYPNDPPTRDHDDRSNLGDNSDLVAAAWGRWDLNPGTPWAIYTTVPCSSLATWCQLLADLCRKERYIERGAHSANMKLLVVYAMVALVAARPGLLRVPKVYNAVITSNQNLSPSRAIPVIQPVIHRTAIGYVPPLYYAQIAPHFSGPEVVHLPPIGPEKTALAEGADVRAESSLESSKASKETEESVGAAAAAAAADQSPEGGKELSKDAPKGKKAEDVPLSFYPNYHSLYYDPYFYTYNGFNPHLAPGTYYVDYQPYGALQPIPATTPKAAYEQRLLPGYHDGKKDGGPKVEKEKIPDVPPPPLPTAVPKSSST